VNTELGNTEPTNHPPAAPNLFWVMLAICVVLALDAAFRFSDLLQQRDQLDQARFVQVQNASRLAQNQQAQGKLEPFSYEILQIAATNDNARKIVQEFNIQWNPGPSAPPPAAGPASQPPLFNNPPSAPSNAPPISSNLPPVK
jgi:hypothetical protein